METREEELFDAVIAEDLELIEEILSELDEEGEKLEYSEENSVLPAVLGVIAGFNMDLFKRIVSDYCNMADLERASAITGIANQHRNDAVKFLVDSGYDVTIRSNGVKDVVEAISEQAGEGDRDVLAYVVGTGKIKGLEGSIARFVEFAIREDLIGLTELSAYKADRLDKAEARGWGRDRPFHPETGIPISFHLCFEDADKMEETLAAYDVEEAEKTRVRTELDATYNTFSRARATAEAAERGSAESAVASGGGSPESGLRSRGPLSPGGVEARIPNTRGGSVGGFGRDSSRRDTAAVAAEEEGEMHHGALGPDPSEEVEALPTAILAAAADAFPTHPPSRADHEDGDSQHPRAGTVASEPGREAMHHGALGSSPSEEARVIRTDVGPAAAAAAHSEPTEVGAGVGEAPEDEPEVPSAVPEEARAVPNARGVGDATAERNFGQKFCSFISGRGWR